MATPWRGVVTEYREHMPFAPDVTAVTLGEGGTPLIRSGWLSDLVKGDVYVKVEGQNPTGSFKDRGMTAAITGAVAEGAKAVVCASTGNTSASMTAYAAHAGLTPIVLVPHGRISAGKMAQAVMHGADIIGVKGNFDDCLDLSRGLAKNYPVALVNSVNPHRIEGQKTASFEIVDVLGKAPDIHVLPVGNAGNITAYWKGFVEYADAGIAASRPRMWGFQAEGAAPIVRGHIVPEPETVATAIRIGNPASWTLAENARDESGGLIDMVADEQILAAQRDLGANEGVFVEPGSATGVAGLLAKARAGEVEPGLTITVTVTGHGLKDIDTPLSHLGGLTELVVDNDIDAAADAAGLR
ncbi:MAG: threonine synthase [Aeromicrobium sp.]|uniref:threonine synthase n=1 Tax=Aeromicrobium sp. TaxID=1871063 RepID=UPI0039E31C02